MTITKRIAFGAAASWFSRGVTIILGLILLPVLFRHLPKEELGVWLLLGQSWAAMGILDLGFGVTFTRRIALAKGKSGADPNASLTPEARAEIADLVTCGIRIYRLMAAGVFVISWALGLLYLQGLQFEGLSHYVVWTAWTILCASQSLNVWATVWTCLVQGVGYVGWDALIASFVSVLTLLSQIVAVLCGGGLVALAAIAAIGALLQRYLTKWLARRNRPDLFSLQGRWNPTVLHGFRALAFRAWLTAVGTVLVQNTDGFFIASYAGSENIPAYRAAFLVLLNIHMLAGAFAASSTVFISQLWQAGAIPEIGRIVQRNLRLGLGIMICGSAAALVAGSSLFDWWLGPSNYIGLAILSIFAATFVLEQQSYIVSTCCRATEHEAFAGWVMAGGMLKLVLAFTLMHYFGLLGLALSTLLAQLLTAHWFILLQGLRRLQFGFGRYIYSVILPCLAAFVLSCSLCLAAAALTHDVGDGARFALISLGSGVALAIFVWFVVLDASHRSRLCTRISMFCCPAK